MRKRTLLVGLILMAITAWAVVRWFSGQASPPQTLGVRDDQLAECPDSPNCVSTFATTQEQSMEAMRVSGTAEEVRGKLESIVRALPRGRIVSSRGRYLHVEFRSRLLGFVDDVEFLIKESDGEDEAVVHFRAAARTGHSDFGVNRRRMEEIRERLRAVQSNDNVR